VRDLFLDHDFRERYVRAILGGNAAYTAGTQRSRYQYHFLPAEIFRVGRTFFKKHLKEIDMNLPPPWFVLSGDMFTHNFSTKLPTLPPKSVEFGDLGCLLQKMFPNEPFAQTGVGSPPGVCPCSERHPDAVRLCFVDSLYDATVEEAQDCSVSSTRSRSESSALGQV
jgi:hypothetical protein